MVRSAFSLIELIFAIVIIGIAVISLPTMNQSTMKGIEGNMVQEAIFAASTELNQVVTANWDDNSIEPTSPNSPARVIDDGTCGTNPLATTAPFYRLKLGHVNQPFHRRCLDANATTTSYSDANTTSVIALDEMQLGIVNVFDDTTTDRAGYKQRYDANITVTRPANFNGNNTNIKRIMVTISDLNGKPITQLSTYSSNIGEIDYYKRSY